MTAPTPITGACAWRGEEMARSTRWVRRLDAAAVAEIDTALDAARSAGVPWHETTRECFPLPGLTVTLAEVARELEDGCGLVTLRGLPVERYTADELRQIWFGLGSHLGRPVFQNRHGELMREIRDEGQAVGERYGQIPSAERRPGHGALLVRPHALERPAPVPHGPLRRGRPPLRAAGPGGRDQQAGELRRRPQRDDPAPAGPRSASSTRTSIAAASARRRADPTSCTRCRSSACATASSPATTR